MKPLLHQKCFNHALREAAARCPDCGRFFCRECVTEHADRVLCAACVRRQAREPLTRRTGFLMASRSAAALVGIFAAWFFFHLVGRLLVSLPESFHEGTLWRGSGF